MLYDTIALYKCKINKELESFIRKLNNLFSIIDLETSSTANGEQDILCVSEDNVKLFKELETKVLSLVKKRIDKEQYSIFITIPRGEFDFGLLITSEKKPSIHLLKTELHDYFINEYPLVVKKITGKVLSMKNSVYKIFIESTYHKYNVIVIEDYAKDKVFYPHDTLLFSYSVSDIEDIVITEKFYKKYGVDKADVKPALIRDKKNAIKGLRLNNKYWYLDKEDVKSLPKIDKWLLLSKHFVSERALKDEQRESKQLCDFFRKRFKDQKFSDLLLTLDNWYYMQPGDIHKIDKKYHSWFDDNLMISGLVPTVEVDEIEESDQKLKRKIESHKSMDYIVSDTKDGTLLGAYNKANTGKKADNLQFWISNDNGKPQYKPLNLKRDIPKQVKTLKPEYSYYLLISFTEEYVESILKDLQGENKIKEYRRNVCLGLTTNNPEVDFLIYTAKEEIVKIEVKRTMSKFNIESQLKKDADIHKADIDEYGYEFIDRYVMIGFADDDTCKHSYHYFVKSEENRVRGLQLDIPLFNSKDKKLHCIVESNYEELKKKLSELFS